MTHIRMYMDDSRLKMASTPTQGPKTCNYEKKNI